MIIVVNFKAYVTGIQAVKLAKICERVAKKEKANVVVAVQAADVFAVSRAVSLPVIAQHVDPISSGAHTGWVLPESIKAYGGVGSLVNHSEHPLPLPQIERIVKEMKKQDLIAIVCASTPIMASKIAAFDPDIIAIEPPELIGGRKSVTSVKPEVITRTIERADGIPVLCGAGVRSGKDVLKAEELGTSGVLIASGVVKAKDPGKALAALIQRKS